GNIAVRQPDWHANVYGQFYDWSMYSNPTYTDPDGTSAQIRQFDRRWIVGARAEKRWTLGPALAVSIGTEERYDHIPAFDTTGPTDGRLSRVVEPRTLRLGTRVNF
ncbi:hypothetical protein NS258_17470, partial [Sphingomonas sanguinis]